MGNYRCLKSMIEWMNGSGSIKSQETTVFYSSKEKHKRGIDFVINHSLAQLGEI